MMRYSYLYESNFAAEGRQSVVIASCRQLRVKPNNRNLLWR